LAERVSTRLTAREGRKFAWTLCGAFGVLAAISWWRDNEVAPLVLAGLSGIALVAGAVIPSHLGPVYRGWMRLAHAISKVTTPVFMGIVYFVVIMPVGLVMRLFGKNPIRHRAQNGSYWQGRHPRTDDSDAMTHQF